MSCALHWESNAFIRWQPSVCPTPCCRLDDKCLKTKVYVLADYIHCWTFAVCVWHRETGHAFRTKHTNTHIYINTHIKINKQPYVIRVRSSWAAGGSLPGKSCSVCGEKDRSSSLCEESGCLHILLQPARRFVLCLDLTSVTSGLSIII